MSTTATMTFKIGIIERRFSNSKGTGTWKTGQKIFIRNDIHKYIMCWDHDDYSKEFKENDAIITQNLLSKEKDNIKFYTAGKNAHLELYQAEDDIAITDPDVMREVRKQVKKADNITPKADYPVKVYQVKVTRARNYNSVSFGVEFSGTLDEAKAEFDILKEVALKALNEIL